MNFIDIAKVHFDYETDNENLYIKLFILDPVKDFFFYVKPDEKYYEISEGCSDKTKIKVIKNLPRKIKDRECNIINVGKHINQFIFYYDIELLDEPDPPYSQFKLEVEIPLSRIKTIDNSKLRILAFKGYRKNYTPPDCEDLKSMQQDETEEGVIIFEPD